MLRRLGPALLAVLVAGAADAIPAQRSQVLVSAAASLAEVMETLGRDYEQRNDAADPVAFAEAVLAEAGDAPIWLVWHDSYETFEGDCEAMAARFGQDRPLTLAVAADEDAFERAHLNRFG